MRRPWKPRGGEALHIKSLEMTDYERYLAKETANDFRRGREFGDNPHGRDATSMNI